MKYRYDIGEPDDGGKRLVKAYDADRLIMSGVLIPRQATVTSATVVNFRAHSTVEEGVAAAEELSGMVNAMAGDHGEVAALRFRLSQLSKDMGDIQEALASVANAVGLDPETAAAEEIADAVSSVVCELDDARKQRAKWPSAMAIMGMDYINKGPDDVLEACRHMVVERDVLSARNRLVECELTDARNQLDALRSEHACLQGDYRREVQECQKQVASMRGGDMVPAQEIDAENRAAWERVNSEPRDLAGVARKVGEHSRALPHIREDVDSIKARMKRLEELVASSNDGEVIP